MDRAAESKQHHQQSKSQPHSETVADCLEQDAPDWKMDTYTNWTTTVDAFAKYNNTLSFSVGSAVVDDSKLSRELRVRMRPDALQ